MYKCIQPFFAKGRTYRKGEVVPEEIANEYPRYVTTDDSTPFSNMVSKGSPKGVILESNKTNIIDKRNDSNNSRGKNKA